MAWKDQARNRLVIARFTALDFYPTCLQLAGNHWQPSPDEHPLDGASFEHVLRNPATAQQRDPIFYLFPGYMDSRAQPTVVAIDDLGGKTLQDLLLLRSRRMGTLLPERRRGRSQEPYRSTTWNCLRALKEGSLLAHTRTLNLASEVSNRQSQPASQRARRPFFSQWLSLEEDPLTATRLPPDQTTQNTRIAQSRARVSNGRYVFREIADPACRLSVDR